MGVRPLARQQSQQALFDALYGQLPFPVAIFDEELRVVYTNAAWAAQLPSIAPNTPDADRLPPELDELLTPGLHHALTGAVVQLAGQSLPGTDGEQYWDISLSPLVEGDAVNDVVCVAHDATARVVAERAWMANARLAAFRADVSQALASSDEIDDVLQACAEAMVRHAPAVFGRIWVLDESENIYRLRASAGLYTRLDGTYSRIPVDWIREEDFPVHGPGLAIDLPRTHRVRDPEWAAEQGLVAWATHPLVVRGQPIGFMVMFARQNFDEDTVKELAAVADAIAQFIERKRAETTLREREALFRSVFESAGDGLVITDLESGRLLEANPAFRAMHGYSRDELLGMSRASFMHPAWSDRLPEFLAAIQAGKPARVQAANVRKDGTAFHVEAQGSTILFQGRPAVLGVVRDITREQEAHLLLEQRIEERTRELQTLLDISRTVTLSSAVDPLIELIFDQMRRLVDYESASIALREGDVLTMVAVRRDEIGQRYPTSLGIQFPVNWSNPLWKGMTAGQVIYSPNVRGDNAAARGFRERVGEKLDTIYGHVVSWLGAPLIVNGELIGVMFISSTQEDRYVQHDIDLVAATANQVAVAIQNARLHEQARAMAALEERQRLARELHDSVSQVLYGIGLGARTARAQLDRDPAGVAQPLDYVLQLAEAGLAEMRALIFELRPESLEQEGLVVALEKQAEATRARHGIAVNLSLGPEPQVPLETKETLYRIAQEAMHNTVKHARATAIELRLREEAGLLRMDVSDNGRGFNANGSFPGHLGLVSMRERVERANGTVLIASAPGKGASIHVEMPVG